MSDPRQIFSDRLQRIEQINRSGGGFEASGTLGQSFYTGVRRRTQRRPMLRLAMLVLTVLVVFKGFLLATQGSADYLLRLQALQGGGFGERLGAFVMGLDPLTLAFAEWLAPLLP